MSEKSYYPYLGDILINGNLLIPTFEILDNNERVCGAEEIGSQHPNYIEWRDAAMKKEQYLAAEKERLKKERALRREKNRNSNAKQT